MDQLNVPEHVSFRRPLYLSLPDYIEDFGTLDRSPRTFKASEASTGVHTPFDRPMVLLHDVVQVGRGTERHRRPSSCYRFNSVITFG